MTNRIFLDAPTGVVELEGEQEFVKEQFERLLPLIEACGFGAGADVADQNDDTGTVAESPPEEQKDTVKATGKRSRRGGARPPRGQSCPDRIMTLRTDGFFKGKRTISQIVDGLSEKGWTHTTNQVAAAGTTMFNRGDLQRTKTGKTFEYFWDRDGE